MWEHSPPSTTQEFAAALVKMGSRVATGAFDESEVLTEVAEGAVAAVHGAVGASVVVLDEAGSLVPRAVYGDLPTKLVALQNCLGEGPTLDAAARAGQFYVVDVAHDRRWQRFGPQAAVLGAGSMICTPMSIGSSVLGTLSIVAGQIVVFDEESARMAAIFAAHATLLISSSAKTSQLETALDSRDLIGQAKGILMERYKIDSVRAFAILVRTSKSLNVKLRSVSETLCKTGILPD